MVKFELSVGRSVRGLLVVAFVVVGCGGLSDVTVGGESHFLSYCDGECGGGFDCISGVCTQGCLIGKGECSGLGDGVECTNQSIETGLVAVCDRECAANADCSGLGGGYFCDAGFCRTGAGAGGSGAGGRSGSGGGAGAPGAAGAGNPPEPDLDPEALCGSTPGDQGTAADPVLVSYDEIFSAGVPGRVGTGASCYRIVDVPPNNEDGLEYFFLEQETRPPGPVSPLPVDVDMMVYGGTGFASPPYCVADGPLPEVPYCTVFPLGSSPDATERYLMVDGTRSGSGTTFMLRMDP